MNIEVYTDGSATTKDKPGGWGYVLVIDGQKDSEGSGHIERGTNNDAELQAAIEGLINVQTLIRSPDFQMQHVESNQPIEITLVSDSQIVLGWASGTYAFRQENKIDKFKQLQMLVQMMHVKTRWVEGHTGDEHNERCDKLAKAARKGLEVPLPNGSNEIGHAFKMTKIGEKKKNVICIWHKDVLKVVDLDANIVEDYHPEHGFRSSLLELHDEN